MVDIRIVETNSPSGTLDEENLDFGRAFTDHMFMVVYKAKKLRNDIIKLYPDNFPLIKDLVNLDIE